jgi:hypothetical protein
VTVILPQVVDRLFCENSFHKVVSVTHKDIWNVFCNEKSHRLLEDCGHPEVLRDVPQRLEQILDRL